MIKKISALLILVIGCALAFGQAAKSFEGSWLGTLDAGGTKLRLALAITKSGDAYSGKLDSLDQGSTIPIDVITVNGDSVHFELQAVGAKFDGKFNADGSEVSGQFSQGGGNLPLTFKRSAAASTPAPAATPAATPSASPAAPQRPIDVPVDAAVPVPPTPFKGGGESHLAYELHVTNFSRGNCVLTKLEVSDAQKKLIATYSGDELGNRVVRPGIAASKTDEKLTLGAGLRLVVFIWLNFKTPAEVPASLQHQLSFKVGDYPEELSVALSPVQVSTQQLVISPPLRGSEWLAGNGPSNSSGHRRALFPISGTAHIAQRFAIDFLQLREDGKSYTGDQKDNKNYRCYGAEALAVADGTVVAVKDGIPENIPGATSRAVPITLETVGGNHVILDLGNGRFAFYAHLQPGSLKVKMGDKVKRGQVLGLVGNSGNSTEPHLHFHISTSNSPLATEGVPYAFREFEVEGKGWGWKPGPGGPTLEKRVNEMPLELEVVRFP
jgi:hypothetical protein